MRWRRCGGAGSCAPGQKVLLVLDQFEQWLFARRGEENTELVAALRQCDGEHVQAIVMVRDDFWLAASRFMRDLEIDLEPNANIALVDLFDLQHARKVLAAFGRAYGTLPDRDRDSDPGAGDLSGPGRRRAWPRTARSSRCGWRCSPRWSRASPGPRRRCGRSADRRRRRHLPGGDLRLTAGQPQAPPAPEGGPGRAQGPAAPDRHRHQGPDAIGGRAARAPRATPSRPRDFDDLVRILDPELRLITPTDPEGPPDEGPSSQPAGRYYQLTHDYLVHSLRDWLTRKQRETRRGRAELRLAERAALWNAKPENRHLPSVPEWATIRALTTKREWTDPQRRMMTRAARVHGLRGLGLAILAALATWGGMEAYGHLRSASLVESLRTASTADVPSIIHQIASYRRWADPRLVHAVRSNDDREHLHASLALLPVDSTQVDYLFKRLLSATPSELPVLRDSLKTHRASLTPKLWAVLESAKPDDLSLLPSACALASYAPDDAQWEVVGSKVAQALVSVNAILLGPWIEALRPVRSRLTAPLATIFQDKERPDSEHKLATNILTDYASDDPDRLAELLMVADKKAYVSLFAVAEKRAEQVLPVLQAELARKATYSWNDAPLDATWTSPAAALMTRIESAQGMLAERFAFCQTMPLDEFLATAEALRVSGYRPVRFAPMLMGRWCGSRRSWPEMDETGGTLQV